MSVSFEGGCLCGAVRYTCNAEPVIAGHCHCIDCRRSSGTGHCSHLGVPSEAVTITGRLSTYDRPADSGNMVSRSFCPTCGAPVYSTNSQMSDPDVFQPQLVVYSSRAPSWDHMDDSLPAFDEMPPPGDMPGAQN
jgi:hypothetical protein